MKAVAVFDTNVLFSAIGWAGVPGQVIELAQSGRIEGIMCVEILSELIDKLRSKLHFSDSRIEDVLGSLLTFLRLVSFVGSVTGECADPMDDMVLECAIVGGATHIVSGDRKHLLPLAQFRGVAIVAPADFVAMVEKSSE
jgi:putative PIN family toxin of toxin-antitoxin system